MAELGVQELSTIADIANFSNDFLLLNNQSLEDYDYWHRLSLLN